MKLKIVMLFTLVLVMAIGGCSLIGGIFEAGFWAGIIGVVIVLLIIFWIVRMIKSRSNE